MTNASIIEGYKAYKGLAPETELHTFSKWKSMGYIVRKGQKAQHKVDLWKCKTKKVMKDDQEVDVNNMFVKTSHLFTFDQVEKMK